MKIHWQVQEDFVNDEELAVLEKFHQRMLKDNYFHRDRLSSKSFHYYFRSKIRLYLWVSK